MRYKGLLLALAATLSLNANTFTGRVSVEPSIVSFELGSKVDSKMIGLISHKLPFECQPALSGAVEYGETTVTLFTKELRKGIEYTCKMDQSSVKFNGGEWELNRVAKISNDRYILSFSDEPKDGEIEAKLKVQGANFSVQNASSKDFYINLDKNISEPNFTLESGFESKFGAKTGRETSYRFEEKTEPESKQLDLSKFARAKTIYIDQISPVSLDDGKLAARIYLKEWLYDDESNIKKNISISGIKRFSVSDVRYIDYYERDKEGADIPKNANYFIDVISDEFKPQSEYTITIKPGFGDSDYVVREEANFNIKTENYKPFVQFYDNEPYISSVGQIGIKSANVGELKVVVEKLLDQNYRYYVNIVQNQGALSSLAAEVASKKYELGGALNEVVLHKIALDFANSGDGVYRVTAYYDKGKSVSKVVYFSDIAITAKLSKDQIFVFANRLGENTMLANANVKIYNIKNEEIAIGATNDEGVFKFSKKDIYKEATAVVVGLAKEQNFLIIYPTDKINENAKISSFDKNETIDAYTHFATDIIRPAEKIKGTSYLRDRNFKPLANMPVRLKITDPQNKTIAQISKKTNDVGAFSFEEEVQSDLTGRFNLEIIYANKSIARNDFSVESFVPARLKNEIVMSQDSFISGEVAIANLSSNYLFGGAASGLSANLEFSFFDYEYTNPNFKNYKFINSTLKNISYQPTQKQIRLNSEGKWQEALAMSVDEKVFVPSIVKGVISFSVNDDGKNVSSSKVFTIFPYENVVGIAADKTFIEPNEKINFKFVTLKSNSDETVARDLKLELKRAVWDYTIDDRGIARWHKSFEDIDSFFIKDNTLEYAFTQSGSYVMIASEPISGASASIDIDVSGWDYSTLQPSKEIAKAQIKLNAKSYKKGDELSADVSSAIKDGLALITLENENGVCAHKVVRIKNNSANAKFTLDFDFDGLYASATIFRLADEGAAPFRTHAKIYASGDKSHRDMPIELTAPQRAKTNESVKISVKTQPNADVSLFVVDLGVLNITNQTPPNPLKFFDIILPDSVFDYDFYSHLTGYKVAGKMLSFGGDMAALKMAAMLEKHDSPVDKKNIETFALMARIQADINGVAQYEFKTPNGFNSAIRVDAIASSAEKIGSKSTQIVVKDDIVIKPSVLAYMLKGDEIEASLRLINTTAQDKNLTISITSSENLELTSESNVSLKAEENQNFKFLMKAKEIGKANFEIKVNDGENEFTNIAKLDIIAPYPLSSYSKSVSVSEPREFKLPKGYKEVYIDASASAASLLLGASKNLISYPYGCAEQRSSRLLALLNAKGQNSAEESDRVRFIELGRKELLKMQKSSGQFGYWDELSNVNEFASTYAADVLFDLDKGGFKLENSTKKRIIEGLKPSGGGLYSLYPLYVKAKYGSIDRAELNRIYDSKDYAYSALGRYLMGATLKMAGYDDEAKAAIEGIKNIDKEYDLRTFGSYLRDRAFVLYLHANYFEKNSFSDELAKSIILDVDKAYSTQERAFVLRAIKAYFDEPKSDASSKIKFSYDGKTDELNGASSIKFTTQDGTFKIEPTSPIFVGISSSAYVELPIRHKKDANRDLDIYRTFVDINGKERALDSLKVGDTIFSKVEIKSRHEIRVGFINEITSACFEAINENLSPVTRSSAVSNKLNISYQTIKDDRVISFYEMATNGSGTLYTPYRVVLSGKCSMPAVIGEDMYNETRTDYDLSQKTFIVK